VFAFDVSGGERGHHRVDPGVVRWSRTTRRQQQGDMRPGGFEGAGADPTSGSA
jgi:hypothetical protein